MVHTWQLLLLKLTQQEWCFSGRGLPGFSSWGMGKLHFCSAFEPGLGDAPPCWVGTVKGPLCPLPSDHLFTWRSFLCCSQYYKKRLEAFLSDLQSTEAKNQDSGFLQEAHVWPFSVGTLLTLTLQPQVVAAGWFFLHLMSITVLIPDKIHPYQWIEFLSYLATITPFERDT